MVTGDRCYYDACLPLEFKDRDKNVAQHNSICISGSFAAEKRDGRARRK